MGLCVFIANSLHRMFQRAARELARRNGFFFAPWFNFNFPLTGWNFPLKCSKSFVVCSICVVIVTRPKVSKVFLAFRSNFQFLSLSTFADSLHKIFLGTFWFFSVNVRAIRNRLNERICNWCLLSSRIQTSSQQYFERYKITKTAVQCHHEGWLVYVTIAHCRWSWFYTLRIKSLLIAI